ncbi:MAG TPA: hypothetical protein VF939_00405 [Puia sp.]
MNLESYLEQRMQEFEEQIALIAACRAEEIRKPFASRDFRILYMFHKDEALYTYCLFEFKLLKEMINEK